jgi:hypothetical protein
MFMCNFAVRINEIDNVAKKYGFEIIDLNSFDERKYYSTLDRNPVRFYFVKNNNIYYIQMDGKTTKRIYKKTFFSFDYNYDFIMRSRNFQISKETLDKIDNELDANHINPYRYNNAKSSGLIPAPNIAIGEVIYIRSNLVFNCCG